MTPHLALHDGFEPPKLKAYVRVIPLRITTTPTIRFSLKRVKAGARQEPNHLTSRGVHHMERSRGGWDPMHASNQHS